MGHDDFPGYEEAESQAGIAAPVPPGFTGGYLNKRIEDDLKRIRRNGRSAIAHCAADIVALD